MYFSFLFLLVLLVLSCSSCFVVPIKVFFTSSNQAIERYTCKKKFLVMILLPLSKYGLANFNVKNWLNEIGVWVSSFLKYEEPFKKYFDSNSTAKQNVMPNLFYFSLFFLFSLFGMYCVNGLGNSCSSTDEVSATIVESDPNLIYRIWS